MTPLCALGLEGGGTKSSFLFCVRPLRLPLGPHLSSRAIVGRPGQPEIHLLLEGVHLGHLHLTLSPSE